MRLDEALVARGLAASRAAAQRAIAQGRVRVNGAVATKQSRAVRAEDQLWVADDGPVYVSRGGEKLAAALVRFGVKVAGRVCLDAGASTGGFTDCLLQAGARRVYAVDVGYGQLAWRLRQDPRVVVMERTNLRHLAPERLPELVDLATLDLSFIGLGKVLPAVRSLLGETGEVIALVKPQFEVGPERVGKGGVVRDPEAHCLALQGVAAAAEGVGLHPAAAMASPLLGAEGNVEFLLHLVLKPAEALPRADLASAVAEGRLLVEEQAARRV